ncbi:MAG: aldehyde dehydrogenase family protein [Planctomycetota bacterium]
MSTHASLKHGPSDLIGGEWVRLSEGGVRSENPAKPDETVWEGSSEVGHVDRAVSAARSALRAWGAMGIERRAEILRRFAEICKARVDDAAALIRDETGKVQWDAKGEAGILAGKVDITLDDSQYSGRRRMAGFRFDMGESKEARCWFRPHGVMAVLGPFNFPMHLPNGHIVPALLMGNTVVFKPSDKTPACGQMLVEMYDEALREAGAPAGVVNLVQGAADVAVSLVGHDGIDGLLFTGSWPVGRRILEANLDRPGRIVALEMGGNNPAVVMPDADLKQAAMEVARCAFITTGQRCTCTRRLVIHEAVADQVIGAVAKIASNLVVGQPDAEHPVFMGPLINSMSLDGVLAAQQAQAKNGGEVILQCSAPDIPGGGAYATPGITRVNRFTATDGDDAGCDVETFGPLLRVCMVSSLDEAIEQANATRFGLAASIFTQEDDAITRFLGEANAGCVNVNCGTAGASSKLPFGGLGFSGNHRPAGSFSLDYCAYPTAGMIESSGAAPLPAGMAFEDSWLG